MAVLPIVFKGAQLGVESTPGTIAAANKQLLSLGFSRIMPKASGGLMFRGQGNKIASASVPPGKQWSEFSMDGLMTYDEMVYALVSALKSVTPSADGTNGKKWVFSNTLASADTKQTYTYENGNAVRSQRALYAFVSALKLEMSKELNKISGSWMAQKRLDDTTITASPSSISPTIIAPQSFDVYIATTQAGLAGASVFPLPLKAVFDLPKIEDVLFRMNSTDASFLQPVDQPLEATLTLGVGDDDNDYGNFLSLIDSSADQWIRIKSLGAVIAGAIPSAFTFILDFAGRLIDPESRTEEAGAATNELVFRNVWNSTAGFSYQLTVINTLATL